MTNYRWVICTMLFFAVVVNYMDRQVLSLTWKDFIAPEFHWDDNHYGTITGTFSLVYAIGMLFAGRLVDFLGTKRGYITAIAVWSTGACLHAFCGIITSGLVSGTWQWSFTGARETLLLLQPIAGKTLLITTISVWMFIIARVILSIGEAGNFPCAIKAIAEYFPKRDRGFATGVFNSGAQIGALIAPFTIPVLARRYGWEMAFLTIGAIGYLWLIVWLYLYKRPESNPFVNQAEKEYIHSDDTAEAVVTETASISPWKAFSYRQTWAVIFGRFLPDSVWWFLLFWAPAFISEVYGYTSDTPQGMIAIFAIYLISMLSLAGSYLPTLFITRGNSDPYAGRMRGMLLFALFPLLAVGVMPLGNISMWYPVVIIGIIAAAHQSWSANVYNVVSDMFPRSVVATVTGAAGLASGLGSFMSNKGAGMLFVYAERVDLHFLTFTGKEAGYMIVFLLAAVAYLLSWTIMKLLVPRYKLVTL